MIRQFFGLMRVLTAMNALTFVVFFAPVLLLGKSAGILSRHFFEW
jgi:hypothetical protein